MCVGYQSCILSTALDEAWRSRREQFSEPTDLIATLIHYVQFMTVKAVLEQSVEYK